MPSSAGVLGVVGSTSTVELKSMGGRGICNDLRLAMEDEEENGELQVEHFCTLGLTVSDLQRCPYPETNGRSARPKHVLSLPLTAASAELARVWMPKPPLSIYARHRGECSRGVGRTSLAGKKTPARTSLRV